MDSSRLKRRQQSRPYLGIDKVPLVVVEAPLAEVAVGQRILQEVSAIQLVPRILDLIQEEM